MLTKTEVLEHMNNYVRFIGFTDDEIVINNNTSSNRTDWHGNEFMFNREYNILFPYNNKVCKIIEYCEDNSIICEFDSIDPNNGDIHQNQKVNIAVIFEQDSNQLINYDPIFEEV